MSAEAAAYQAGAPNPYADKGLVPSLRYDNPLPGKGRKNVVRFDGIEGKTLIDRKLSFYSSEDGKDQLLRQSEAIKDNPGYSLRIEVPNKVQERRVDKYLKKLGITNIAIKVVAP